MLGVRKTSATYGRAIVLSRNEEWLRLIRFPYEGRVRLEFDKLINRGCERYEYEFWHLPHIWHDPERVGSRYFCRGWEH